ncbi:EAL domain-containing protein [uncultured Desulfuromonas sp.]|uniref:EAL domain-containing protein n=1 Tax=uncultured Desulfuromonas sp. TaxID=181013 RepID=UPI002AAC454C|nr:EAL domain-containing protein [uncultured Desulfuromonas sp.]
MTLSIRAKTFLGILMTLVILTCVFVFSLKLFNEKNIDRAETQFGNEALLRVENLLQEKENNLVNIAHSISVLDPFWHGVQGNNDNTLPLAFFDTLPVDFVLIVDSAQTPVFQQAFHALDGYNGDLFAYVSEQVSLATRQEQHGLVRFEDQPLLLVTRPIVYGDDDTSSVATVAVGLLLADAFWQRVNNELQMHAGMTLAEEAPSSCPDVSYNCLKKSLSDLHGHDTFVLRSGSFRFMREFSRHNLWAFFGLFAFASVVMVFITQMILDVLVLSRLVQLDQGLEKIGRTPTPDQAMVIEVDGDDEVAVIGNTINEMLERLHVGDQIRFQQEKRFSDMIEHSGLVVIGIDHTSSIILFNQAAEKATGYAREDVLQENFFNLFTSPATAEQLSGYIAKAMAQGEFTGDFHAPLKMRDGRVRQFLWDAIFEYDECGQIDNFIGFGRDVTESLAAERRLKLITKVFENAAEAIIVTDRRNQIIEVNQAFISITGYSRGEVLGQNPRLLQSDHHDGAFFAQMWKQLIDTGHWEGEVWNRRKDGETYVSWVAIDTIRDHDGSIKNFFSISSDISQIKEAERQLHQLAYFDALTGLPNRLSFSRQLEEYLTTCDEACNLAVMALDLNAFKLINESLGPVLADKLLQMFAERLTVCSHDNAFVARIGGDEFAFILRKQRVRSLLDELFECVESPFVIGAQRISLTTSVGIAVAPDDGETVSELLKNANIALYSIKDIRRNSFSYYEQEMSDRVVERMNLAEMLREALDNEEFELYYQPKIRLKDGMIVGAEALLRWHSRDGMVPPDRFIPIAEQTGLILPIGEWVLRQACQQAQLWRQVHPDFHVGVNLSPAQFDLDYLPRLVNDILEESHLPAEALELEITEGMIIENIDDTVQILQSLRELGVEISIDDFGTGYSSLSYLTRLPLDILKIDRSFMFEVPDSRDSTNVVLSILALARSLNLKVTAEGVETEEHVTLLHDHHCTYIQGYFSSRPLPVADFEKFMHRRQCRCVNCEGITWFSPVETSVDQA